MHIKVQIYGEICVKIHLERYFDSSHAYFLNQRIKFLFKGKNGEWGTVRGESSVGGEASQITEENDKEYKKRYNLFWHN